MGSVSSITLPVFWRVIKEGILKNDSRSRAILQIEIGTFCDDPDDGTICVYMFKKHFDKIMYGKLDVVRHPYDDKEPIELFQNGVKITPIKFNGNIIF